MMTLKEEIKQRILDNRCGWEWQLANGGRKNPEQFGDEFVAMLERERLLQMILDVESAKRFGPALS